MEQLARKPRSRGGGYGTAPVASGQVPAPAAGALLCRGEYQWDT